MFGLEAVFRNGVPVGHLRRSDYGFFIDKTIGYGYIRNPDGGVVSRTATQPPPLPLHFSALGVYMKGERLARCNLFTFLKVSFSSKYTEKKVTIKIRGRGSGTASRVAKAWKWNNPSVICWRL